MIEKVAIIAIRIAGWVMSAPKLLIAEQQWHAKCNLIKGHSLDVVFSRACAAFRRKK